MHLKSSSSKPLFRTRSYKMAEIRDDCGNPIQLTDEHGNPVELTDERGQPMQLKGVAVTTVEAETHPATEAEPTAGTGAGEHGQQGQQHEEAISRSSSSSSSGDDHGQGVRRKKGIKEKIKEKLTGGKHKDEHSHTTTVTSTATTTISSSPGTYEHQEHEKKSPVTIADQAAEESMVSIILESFPSHAIYGEENGWRGKEKFAEYVWVLDPIDGTKSFITGKPLFGTLIALLYMGRPILGIIDQPVLGERWIGRSGRKTTLNGQEVSTRSCAKLSQAYLYTTSPHLFSGDAEEAFGRVRNKPYDFLSLVPVIEGAGGVITDWKGNQLQWEASPDSCPKSFNVVAAGDKQIHQEALDSLQWQ